MLNIKSEYYADQLAEKLQLMLATHELKIMSWWSDGESQGVSFIFLFNSEVVNIKFRHIVLSDDKPVRLDLTRAIATLAHELQSNLTTDMERHASLGRAQVHAQNKG